jgi:chaperonin cofactor prefoldin
MSTDKFGHFTFGAHFHHEHFSCRLALKRKSSLFASEHDIGGKHPPPTDPSIEARLTQINNKEKILEGKIKDLQKSIKEDLVTKLELATVNKNLSLLIDTATAKITDLELIKSSVDGLLKNVKKFETELKNLDEKIKQVPADVISHIGIEVGPHQIKFRHKALREIRNATNESDAINLWQFKKLTEDIRPQLESHQLDLNAHRSLLDRTLVTHVTNLKRLLANNRIISGLAPPESGTDAINLDYLRAFVKSSIKDLDNKLLVMLSEKADKKK